MHMHACIHACIKKPHTGPAPTGFLLLERQLLKNSTAARPYWGPAALWLHALPRLTQRGLQPSLRGRKPQGEHAEHWHCLRCPRQRERAKGLFPCYLMCLLLRLCLRLLRVSLSPRRQQQNPMP